MIAIVSTRVLIADPSDVLRAVYREFLTWQGFTVATAADGLQCVAQLRRFRPRVLVLDAALPMGGGDGVLALMHEDPRIARIPVVVLTARRDRDKLKQVLAFPVEAVHAKPLKPSHLVLGIRWVLDRAQTLGCGRGKSSSRHRV